MRHKILQDTIEGGVVVKTLARQKDKVVNRHGRFVGKELNFDVAFGGLKGGEIEFGRVNGHGRRR